MGDMREFTNAGVGGTKGTFNDEKNMARMGIETVLKVCSDKLSDDVSMCSQDTSDDLISGPSFASPVCLAAVGNTR